jgi:microsomal dipeptidase-like Zn-dependent dipeptidase
MPTADLHCDLLWYLGNDKKRTILDPESQASLPSFREGEVALQIFPIYTQTAPDSVRKGMAQWEIYKTFPSLFQSHLTPRLAIENASSFCTETDALEFHLLEVWHKEHPIVYISLTWNEENRFGGGAATKIGLKEEGKKLLEWMSGKNIAVDLSHASDALAEDILSEIKHLQITPIASHSNFRAIYPHLRNLPDHLAQEICAQGGIIGLNLVRHFVGPSTIKDIYLHVHHAHQLGLENHLCLGADFFPEIDVELEKAHMKPYFFEGFSTSSCYPKLEAMLRLNFSEEFVENLMHKRLIRFLEAQ